MTVARRADESGVRRDQGGDALIVLAGLVAFGVPAVLFYRLVLYHFYVKGGFLLDSGMLAALMWHNPISLPLPASTWPQSFFSHHVAPVFILFSAISALVPLTMTQFFAAFVGVSEGLLTLPVFCLLVFGLGLRRGADLALSALIACAFAFNGIALSIARFPHFETFGAACLMLFLTALVLRWRVIAVVAFILALMTREDMGLHAFGVLFLWAAWSLWRGRPWRELAAFGLAGLVWSATVLIAQHILYPAESSFVRIYSGDPPLAHLTGSLLQDRLSLWLVLHAGLVLAALYAGFWAWRIRGPRLMLGFVACLPWLALHFAAVSKLAGLMVAYYSFPFLNALFWPLLVARAADEQPAPDPRRYALVFLGLVLITLPLGRDWNPAEVDLPRAFWDGPSASQRHLTDQAVAAISAARPGLGQVVVVESVAGLAPHGFTREEIAGMSHARPDTFVYFAGGWEKELLAPVESLPVHLAIPGTNLLIATNRSEQTVRDLGIPR